MLSGETRICDERQRFVPMVISKKRFQSCHDCVGSLVRSGTDETASKRSDRWFTLHPRAKNELLVHQAKMDILKSRITSTKKGTGGVNKHNKEKKHIPKSATYILYDLCLCWSASSK
jgi:hypothetical protein